MNWPFPFHLFLISIRTQLTFSGIYQASGPAHLLTLLQHNMNIALQNEFYLLYVHPSALISFISLTAQHQGKAAQTNHDIPFSWGNQSCLAEYSFLYVSLPDVKFGGLVLQFEGIKTGGWCRHWGSSHVRALKQQETNYRIIQGPRGD